MDNHLRPNATPGQGHDAHAAAPGGHGHDGPGSGHEHHPPRPDDPGESCGIGVYAFPLTVSGKHVKVSGPTATGLELKLLGEVPEGNDLFLRVPGGRDRGVADRERVELVDCQVYYDLPPANLGGGLV